MDEATSRRTEVALHRVPDVEALERGTGRLTRLLCRIAFGLLISGGCWAQTLLPNPVSVPGMAWPFYGFVIHAPQDDGWFTRYKSSNRVDFFKVVENDAHRFGLDASIGKLDSGNASADFVGYLQANRTKSFDLERFEVGEHREKAVTQNGHTCSRYYLSGKKKRAPPLTPVTLVSTGITCIHPENPELVVDVSYFEEGGSEQLSGQISDAGEKFISSLRFTRVKKSPEEQEARKFMESGGKGSLSEEVVKFHRVLADGGDRLAANTVGQLLLLGGGAEKNFDSARKYLEIAAQDGYVGALYNLGSIYSHGFGVPVDSEEAARWYLRAADQRDGDAQLALANMYAKGEGVPRDAGIAEQWLKFAANNGNRTAMQRLMRR